MSYGDVRDQVQFEKLDARISEFVTRFYATQKAMPDVRDRRTVIVFPGGMGSRLLRGLWPYDVGAFFSYYTGWLDYEILITPASDLQMRGDIDDQGRIVTPDSAIDVPGVQPYRGFTDWCLANKLDWFIFGWDWRRSLEPTVDFFLDRFLDWFRRRVMDLCQYDPLQNCTLIGHSFGGMIVKLILDRWQHPHVQTMHQAITVGTPFYGHGDHILRYFRGEPLLEFKGRPAITRTVSSMRGPYTLMFLDYETFLANREALSTDPDYPLLDYPSMDADSAHIPADPYNPLTNGDKVRYPRNYLFSMSDLAAARSTCRAVAARLDRSVEAKLFHIRGVQQADQVDRRNTIVSQRWGWIEPDFDVEADAPPFANVMGAGDALIPAWSARLVSTPAQNIRTVKFAGDHTMMMADCHIQSEIASVLGLANPVSVPQPPVDVASEGELRLFLDGLAVRFQVSPHLTEAERRRGILDFLANYSRKDLDRFIAAIYLNVLKSPPQDQPPGKP